MQKKVIEFMVGRVKSFCILMVAISVLLAGCRSKTYNDIDSVFVSSGDIYAVGSVNDGSSMTDVPTLWINGQSQVIGNQGNFNSAKSVFVSGDDIYVAVTENDQGRALLWKNGESQLLAEGLYSDVNCVYVDGDNVYVAGQKDEQPTLWKNGKPQNLGITGEAEAVVVQGSNVYVAGYVGDYSNSQAVMWKNGEMEILGRGHANSVFVADNGDVYVAGKLNGIATYWKNGEEQYLENLGKSSAYSITVADNGSVIVAGQAFDEQLKSIAIVWVDGVSCRVDEDDMMRYQTKSVVSVGNTVYLGGAGKGELCSVWKYDVSSDLRKENFIRALTGN